MALVLDPQISAALSARPLLALLPRGVWRQRRKRFEEETRELNLGIEVPHDVACDSETIPAADGHAIRLLIYRRCSGSSGAVVLYLHGGGHFFCDAESCDPACRRYASETGVTVVSVDYRFAPEHPYPKGIEDAYAALLWVHRALPQLDGSTDRVAVMGESAGGGMAAALTLMTRDRDGPPIAAQLLIYPMLDDRTAEPERAIEEHVTWTHDDNATAWPLLLGDLAGTEDIPAYAAPSRAANLRLLPAAYIEVGQLDLFRAEDVAYANRLMLDGVPVELHVLPGVPHDFERLAPQADVTRWAHEQRHRILMAL